MSFIFVKESGKFLEAFKLQVLKRKVDSLKINDSVHLN